MKWRRQWALEIADSKAGVGSLYQDGLADCVAEADGAMAELEAENKRLGKEMEMALLHLDASVCECGEPLKETDAADTLRQALGNPATTVYE